MELSTMGGRRMTSQHQPHRHHQRTHRHRKETLTKHASKYKCNQPTLPTSNLHFPDEDYIPRKHIYPEDPDTIEVYLEDDPIKFKDPLSIGTREGGKWRTNIVATMERYDPGMTTMTSTLPSPYMYHYTQPDNLNAEYSYAYCEPSLLKHQQQQQNPPPHPNQQHQQHLQTPAGVHKLSTSVSNNTLSKLPSTNSLRALLTKSFRKSSISSSATTDRHTFTTRYGTKENIYEDVSIGARTNSNNNNKLGTSEQSMDAINKLNIEEELRQVQDQHERIMGELNLSVEALLMPTQAEQELMDRVVEEENFESEQTQERLSPTTSQPSGCGGDVDSGISGSSSSGASYSDNVNTKSSCTNKDTSGSSGEKLNFWNKIGKLKFPGVFGGSSNNNNNNHNNNSNNHCNINTNNSNHNNINNNHNSTSSSNSSSSNNCSQKNVTTPESENADDDEQAKWWKLQVCKSSRSIGGCSNGGGSGGSGGSGSGCGGSIASGSGSGNIGVFLGESSGICGTQTLHHPQIHQLHDQQPSTSLHQQQPHLNHHHLHQHQMHQQHQHQLHNTHVLQQQQLTPQIQRR